MNTYTTKIWATILVAIFYTLLVGCGATQTTKNRADRFVAGIAENGAVGSRNVVAYCNPTAVFDGCTYRVSETARTQYRNGKKLKDAPQSMAAPPPQVYDGGYGHQPAYYGQSGYGGYGARPGLAFGAGVAIGNNRRPHRRRR